MLLCHSKELVRTLEKSATLDTQGITQSVAFNNSSYNMKCQKVSIMIFKFISKSCQNIHSSMSMKFLKL